MAPGFSVIAAPFLEDEALSFITNALTSIAPTDAAAVDGGYARWTLPQPATFVNDMMISTGVVTDDAQGRRQCPGDAVDIYSYVNW